jgi:3-methyladenine DNA glycosylase AlkD
MTAPAILARLHALANADNVAGMARYGISATGTLGVAMPALRALAREIGHDHALATALWESGIHEGRILASLVDTPSQVTRRQMDRWIRDVDSWDVCDQLCQNLFRYTPHAFDKARQWSTARAEFTRRAAFSLMAGLAVKSKAPNEAFEAFFPLIVSASTDGRNMVRKAVNWALRQTGKRNRTLHASAIATATSIQAIDSRAARWIASDALRELRTRFADAP